MSDFGGKDELIHALKATTFSLTPFYSGSGYGVELDGAKCFDGALSNFTPVMFNNTVTVSALTDTFLPQNWLPHLSAVKFDYSYSNSALGDLGVMSNVVYPIKPDYLYNLYEEGIKQGETFLKILDSGKLRCINNKYEDGK